jgi:DNA repair exonuclease SbcCD nuclease subunit
LCHLADIHLGYRRYSKVTKHGFNQREVDINLAFREAIDRVIGLNPDLVVIAGDLFHSVRPSNAVVAFCCRELKRLRHRSGAQIVIIAGNHEAPRRSDTGSVLRVIAEVEGCSVAVGAKEVFTFESLGVAVHCLPHGSLQSVTPGSLRADDRVKHNVLVLHGQLGTDTVSDFGGEAIDLAALAPHEWDYIALGHVHVRRTIGLNAAYAGAIEHTAVNLWAEAREPKGFWEIDLESGKRTFHALTSPREVVSLDPINALELEPHELTAVIEENFATVPGGITGKLVRLEVFNLARSVWRQIDPKALRRWRTTALNITLSLTFEDHAGAPVTVSDGGLHREVALKEELLAFCRERESNRGEPGALERVIGGYFDGVEGEHEALEPPA